MTALVLQFPLLFLKFWFWEAPDALLGYFVSLNNSFFQLFSFPLLLRTFFKPIKNEYRQGLVGFSRVMGMGIKLILISICLLITLILLGIEFIVIVGFLLFPFGVLLLLFV